MLWIIVLVSLIRTTCGAIYHLNASEYHQMPPLFGLDEYEACLDDVRGMYCVVKIDLFSEPGNELMRIIQEYSDVTTKHYNHSYLERGVCVRRTCERFVNNSLEVDGDKEGVLGACLNESIWTKYGVQARISQLYYCDKQNEDNGINTSDWIVAVALLLIVLCNLIGTTYDVTVNKPISGIENERGNKIITSFSIIRNWHWLVSAEPDEDRIKSLQVIHGIRSFTNVCTIMAHAMWIMACGFIDKPQDFENNYETSYYQLIFNGMMIVQVFFVISGFLLVYYMLIKSEKYEIGWMAIPKIMFIRWWRLSPALAVMLAFNATWLRHLGSGPLWKLFVTNSVVADCRTYWWHHLLYINNYVPDDKYCFIQTWHISADTQIFFLGLIVYLATRGGRRITVLLTLLLLGVLLPAFHVWLWDMDGVLLMVPEFYRTMQSDVFHYMHVFGHNNIVCFVIGMASGEIVYKMQKKNIDFSKNKPLSAALYLTIPGIILLMLCGRIFYADSERASLPLRMVYAGMHRLVMGLIVGIGLSAAILGTKNWFRDLFEWRGWVVPSRLSYAMFLIHFNFIYIFMGTRTQLGPVSFFYLTICTIAFVGLAMIFSLPFYLMVEAPINRLLKTLINIGKSGQGEAKHGKAKEDHQD